jgi:hypothetical protein
MGKYEDLEQEEAKYEAGRLVRDVATMTIGTALATIAGPVAAVGTLLGIAGKSIADKHRRERERDGDD